MREDINPHIIMVYHRIVSVKMILCKNVKKTQTQNRL